MPGEKLPPENLEALNFRLPQSTEEAEARYKQWRETDPYPKIQPSLLNSTDFLDYVAAVGMLYPFRPLSQELKTASCALRLQGKILYWDSEKKPYELDLQVGAPFTLQPNSIAFVTLEPYLRIPNYIALRFNLKIDNVYRGLLLGTGPLIDPGYCGKLSFPLHNLTTNSYEFKGGDSIIWVEFTKLSSHPHWHPRTLPTVSPQRQESFYIPLRQIPDMERPPTVKTFLCEAVGSGHVCSSIPEAMNQARKSANDAADRAKVAAEESATQRANFDKALLSTMIGLGIAIILSILSFGYSVYSVYSLFSQEQSYLRDSQDKLHAQQDGQRSQSKDLLDHDKEIKSLQDELKRLEQSLQKKGLKIEARPKN